jgi:hypothetical protein
MADPCDDLITLYCGENRGDDLLRACKDDSGAYYSFIAGNTGNTGDDRCYSSQDKGKLEECVGKVNASGNSFKFGPDQNKKQFQQEFLQTAKDCSCVQNGQNQPTAWGELKDSDKKICDMDGVVETKWAPARHSTPPLLSKSLDTKAALDNMKCPSSPALVHASAQIATEAPVSCDKVKEEVLARIQGQATGAWHDPHNNGTYYIDDSSSDSLQIHRVSGNHKPGPYTDKITLTLTSSSNSCLIAGCSESQSFSIGDFGTNYCNIRMLYCGSADGCKPVKNNFASAEGKVETSIGASKGIQNCLKVKAVVV